MIFRRFSYEYCAIKAKLYNIMLATYKSRNKEILYHIKLLLLAAALILYDVININIY